MLVHRLESARHIGVWFFYGSSHDDAALERYLTSIGDFERMTAPAIPGTGLLYLEAETPMPNAIWRKRVAEATARLHAGNVFALVNAPLAIRGVSTAIRWQRPSLYTVESFATLDEACAWLLTHRGPPVVARAKELLADLQRKDDE
jgi:hypothetical protein